MKSSFDAVLTFMPSDWVDTLSRRLIREIGDDITDESLTKTREFVRDNLPSPADIATSMDKLAEELKNGDEAEIMALALIFANHVNKWWPGAGFAIMGFLRGDSEEPVSP